MANNKKNPEKLFSTFIDTFIIEKKSIFDESALFEDKEIEECLNLIDKKETTKMEDLKKKFSEGKYNDVNKTSYLLLWHCYYIMYMMGNTAKTFLDNPYSIEVADDNFIAKGDKPASTKQVYSQEPIRPFRCLLQLFKDLWEQVKKSKKTDEGAIKESIIKYVLKVEGPFATDEKSADYDERIKNILLYLCDSEKYVPIISQSHKNSILKYLSFVIGETLEEVNAKSIKEQENCITNILNKINGILGNEDKSNNFYHSQILPFWQTSQTSTSTNKDGDLDVETLLLYKKAVVLYGPPGTSKTYTANELAKSIISKKFAETLKEQDSKKDKFQSFFNNHDSIFGKKKAEIFPHIHRLQLHSNYTYEDFIIGKTIKGESGATKVDVQKGYLMELLEKIEKDREDQKDFSDLPHFLILDEINRVDISRVFGELFSAMEPSYRKDGVDLPLNDKDGNPYKLIIPENLYIIGTMNQIDFSLEQVDFALRRRFAWVKNTFDKDRLINIINEKADVDIADLMIDDYANYCEALNKIIGEEGTLGEDYWIGHTFFAEIVDLKKDANINDWDKAREFLWHISIKPMIEAYCGSMDSDGKKNFISKCQDAFIGKDKTKTISLKTKIETAPIRAEEKK